MLLPRILLAGGWGRTGLESDPKSPGNAENLLLPGNAQSS